MHGFEGLGVLELVTTRSPDSITVVTLSMTFGIVPTHPAFIVRLSSDR